MASDLTLKNLRILANERLMDAKALSKGKRYKGAIYMAGYAVEIALKYRICKTLRWSAFKLKLGKLDFKIHDLADLLALSGVETRIKVKYLAEWSIVEMWKPEQRYEVPAKPPTDKEARDMIEATAKLIGYLCTRT